MESRDYWKLCEKLCKKSEDLILCIDFGIKHELSSLGYNAFFLDHIESSEILERYNFDMHNYINNWYKNERGEDIFNYKGYNFGDSLSLYIINDVTYFCHYFFNIINLKKISFSNLFIATNETVIFDCLKICNLKYIHLNGHFSKLNNSYFFPIIKWVNQKTQRSLLSKIKNFVAIFFDIFFEFYDHYLNSNKPKIYVQQYYPTDEIIEELISSFNFHVILQNYVRFNDILKLRRVGYRMKSFDSKSIINSFIEKFKVENSYNWYYGDIDLSKHLNSIIEFRLSSNLDFVLNRIDNIENYLPKSNLKLMVSVTNLWVENRLIMQYCFNNKIPVFTIINGLLNLSFYQDAKDSNFVNCYSESIKKNYFQNSPTAHILGDPRMDKYSNLKPKNINRLNPTIIIGAGGYDSIDLNSYVAFEFDFLFDILYSIKKSIHFSKNTNIVIKVRGNGYIEMYKNFVTEYFYDLNVFIVQDVSFFDIIKKADLYISIFSQTIIEAACLGIPTIYYKKDTQFIHPPFDCDSELVTAMTTDDLIQKIDKFYNNDDSFNLFLNKKVLEKYIGPLDGLNKKRNMEFIIGLTK